MKENDFLKVPLKCPFTHILTIPRTKEIPKPSLRNHRNVVITTVNLTIKCCVLNLLLALEIISPP